MADDDGTIMDNPLFAMAVPLIVCTVLIYVLYKILQNVLKFAETFNKALQDELAVIEDRRRKLFLKREQLGEEEFFFEKYGYSYDWVFVFPILEEPEEQAFQVLDEKVMHAKKEEWRKNLHRDVDFKKYWSMKTIVENLQTAGLETKLFYSTQRDECYCKIRCPPARMEYQADLVDYRVLMDMDRTAYCMRKGRRPHWEGRVIRDELNLCEYSPFEYIYGRFEADDEKIILYKRYKLTAQIDSPFRNIDRVKLINEIFRQPPTGDTPGCGFEVDRLIDKGSLIGAFPLHDNGAKIQLEKKWLNINTLPSQQPYEAIKDYYGEKICMYFGWLGLYTTWLAYASGPGFLTFLVAYAEGRNDNSLTPVFAAFMTIWGTCFLEAWKRDEITYVMKWGMTGFEQEETTRPAFWGKQRTEDGAQVTSHVDGTPDIHFPPVEAVKRKAFSNVVTVVFIFFVVFAIYYIFQLKGAMNVEPYKSQFTVFGFIELGTLVPSVLNAVSIGIFSSTWKVVSLKLTIAENHRTDTYFEDSLIAKTFSFEFVNKYAACFYAAFMKKYFVSGDPCDPTCFDELATTLSTLFVVELSTGNLGEVAGAYFGKQKREKAESEGVHPDRHMSQVEKQYTAETFDKMLGTFRNYQEMAFQFGYATLFSAAFPLAPVLAYINNFVEIRVDAWKLLQCSRRPEPSGAEDIGAWYGILDLISLLSVMTNGLLIFFVAESGQDILWTNRFTAFIVFEHVLILFKILAAALIEDVPVSTQIQLDRQDFIVSKVIENAPDDNGADGAAGNDDNGGFEILEKDEDPMF